MTTLLWQIAANTWELLAEAAPWLLLGLVTAGLMKAWLPERRMAAWLGGNGLWPLTKAATLGAPLPLCSCGVIPAALGLHRAGASRASTTAFLIATPETGADSIGASYALLGPFFTVMRPVSAVVSGIVTGLLSTLAPATPRRRGVVATGDCCGNGEPAEVAASTCCDGDSAAKPLPEDVATRAAGGWQRTWAGLHYAFTAILDDISSWLAIGLVIAGVTVTLVPPAALAEYGGGITAMLVMLVVGVPVYVCATESTPIATAMLLAGVSPGAVLVFLLAGPATNLATMGALSREFGWRYVAVYVAGISACALSFGLLTDVLLGWAGITIAGQLQAGGALIPQWLSLICAVVLLVLAVPPLRAPLLRFVG